MAPFLGASERLVLIRDGYYSPDLRRRRRAVMLLALDRGVPASSVARTVGCARTTVYYWLRLYQEHRDVEALSGGFSRSGGLRPTRTAAVLNSLKPDATRRTRRPAAPMDARARRRLRLDAEVHPDPRRRLGAAMAWAMERGVAAEHAAHVAGVSRQAVYRAWGRARAGRGVDSPKRATVKH
jgi:transposase-like protein